MRSIYELINLGAVDEPARQLALALYSLRPEIDVPGEVLRKPPPLSSDKHRNPPLGRLPRASRFSVASPRTPTRAPAACSVALSRRRLHRLADRRPPSPARLASSLLPHEELKMEGVPFSSSSQFAGSGGGAAPCILRLRRGSDPLRGSAARSCIRTPMPRRTPLHP